MVQGILNESIPIPDGLSPEEHGYWAEQYLSSRMRGKDQSSAIEIANDALAQRQAFIKREQREPTQ